MKDDAMMEDLNTSTLSELSDNHSQTMETDVTVAQNGVIVLGDSNVIRMRGYFKNLDFNVEPLCRTGATLRDVEDLLKESKLEPTSVKGVLIHLGTCHWSADDTVPIVSGEVVYHEYVEAVNACASRFPNAEYLVSSVPPRLPSSDHDT
jgi:hypothetical protein